MNQKAEAVLAGNDIYYKEYQSKEFTPEEVDEYTLVLAMDSDVRDILLEKYSELNEDNTFVLAFFVGEELETMDPYGEPIVKYGLCFEDLKETTRNLLLKLENGDGNE
jgi:protein-tyrosine phosphatase